MAIVELSALTLAALKNTVSYQLNVRCRDVFREIAGHCFPNI